MVRGRVVDQQGRPVPDVAVSTFWNANGFTLEELQKFEKEGGDATMLTINEGRMEPWGFDPTKTDGDGKFSTKMGPRNYFLLAIDKQRKRGALIVLDPPKALSSVELELVPLVRLHGRVRIAARPAGSKTPVTVGEEPKSVIVNVRLRPNVEVPMGQPRVVRCCSTKLRFDFWLPSGDYQLEVHGEMSKPHHLFPLR